MLVRINRLPIGRKHMGGLLLLTFISILCVAFSMTGNDDFDFARRELLLRRVGDEILLQLGDSNSRVLPVKKVAKDEYQLRFEKDFSFQPAALVSITRRVLAHDPLASDYVVNIQNCADESVAYGYAISGNKKEDIVACLGRKQPTACYFLTIKFHPAGTNTARNGYLLCSLALLAVIGYIFLRAPKPRVVVPDNQPALPEDPPAGFRHPATHMFPLGSMLFDAAARKLLVNEKAMDLTKTETRVLRIFAVSPNEVIERSRLQKEIWEDEGVIVGRSLDMFISKLRKKLEADPAIKIAVIRGKGYKLEISS